MIKNLVISIISLIFVTLVCQAAKKNVIDDNNNYYQDLDKDVITMAQMLKKDARHYRLHVRTDLDGARIYRQVGKYVIIDPQGEITYVPDPR